MLSSIYYFFLFYISVFCFYSYIAERRRLKRIFHSNRKARNRYHKKSIVIKYLTFNK
ncbi:TPA: small membrane protein [Klebsiella pneumoniae]|uniref:small membrane protein n=1 Tax=Klebsiella pneumoniae TaxID=573 RepID=UPI00115A2F6F|nr:small membrane protein [Klebsiella pneumoniae]QGA59109.1 small membrane protein [Klebsiella pneumoniae]HBQ2929352.1 small membrane protein [Klebsiella pneumoniae]HBQ3108518.1 small membrane protein [Klebsiella pneumoniae]HBQ3346204.1 small membrane protein [Klebsiella pneumoniae]HBQ3443741.1 small membrane protein [Klebsiella pneumoniae]